MKENKDIFNGKIKKEYVSYLITSYVVISILFLPVLCFFAYVVIKAPIEGKIIVGLALIGCLYLTIINPFLTLFVIRQYPKYPKLRRLLLNSEYYFVGNNKRESSGRYRDRLAFDKITTIIDKKKKK